MFAGLIRHVCARRFTIYLYLLPIKITLLIHILQIIEFWSVRMAIKMQD